MVWRWCDHCCCRLGLGDAQRFKDLGMFDGKLNDFLDLLKIKSTASLFDSRSDHRNDSTIQLEKSCYCQRFCATSLSMAFWWSWNLVCFDFPLSSRCFSPSCVHLFEAAPWSACLHHQSFHRCYLVSSPPSSTAPKDPPQVQSCLEFPKLHGFFWLRFYPHLERWWRSVPKIAFRMCIAFHIAYGPSVHSNISHKVKGLKCCSHYQMTGPKNIREKFVYHPGPSLGLARQNLMKNIAVAGQSNARVGLTVLQVQNLKKIHHCNTSV